MVITSFLYFARAAPEGAFRRTLKSWRPKRFPVKWLHTEQTDQSTACAFRSLKHVLARNGWLGQAICRLGIPVFEFGATMDNREGPILNGTPLAIQSLP